MARLEKTPEQYFKRNLAKDARVLLINPPVQERRYHWLRWNQPVELLRLSSWLKGAHKGIDVRLFDFMFPDSGGSVPKHKVKETWTTQSSGAQLWHFGTTFEDFETEFAKNLRSSAWIPDCIVISSLTSYWHVSIEKLLIKICSRMGRSARKRIKIVLYGNYPRFEPEHAAAQSDADVAMTTTIDSTGLAPDFELYQIAYGRLPSFFGLNVEDDDVGEHLKACVDLSAANRGKSQRPRPITVAFFNDDVCGPKSRLDRVQEYTRAHPNAVQFEGIAGMEPASMTAERIELLGEVGFRSAFVEHARLPGGATDQALYQPLLDAAIRAEHAKKTGKGRHPWLERAGGADHGGLTAFVSIGMADDDMDKLVESTLVLNRDFQSIILKPFGYSPTIDDSDCAKRKERWPQPCMGSPQWYPYAGSTRLAREDYDYLMGWQNLLNRRVKGTTFDFMDDGAVARIVRETLVAESWKARVGAR